MPEVPTPRAGAAPEPSGAAPGGPTIEDLQRASLGPLAPLLQRIHAPLHIAAGVTLLALLAWTAADIVGRTRPGRHLAELFFDTPMRGTVELTEVAVVVMVYLGLSYAESKDSHITVDLLYVHLGVRFQLVLRVFAGLVALAVVVLMTWRLMVRAGELADRGYTTALWRLPLHWVAWLAVAGAVAFAVAIFANTAVALFVLISGSRPAVGPADPQPRHQDHDLDQDQDHDLDQEQDQEHLQDQVHIEDQDRDQDQEGR